MLCWAFKFLGMYVISSITGKIFPSAPPVQDVPGPLGRDVLGYLGQDVPAALLGHGTHIAHSGWNVPGHWVGMYASIHTKLGLSFFLPILLW